MQFHVRLFDAAATAVREEILECTARFVANRVAHKLRAAEVDELTAKLREAAAK